jgi:peptidoglycan/LPS O-acetylase OafA/YrhL
LADAPPQRLAGLDGVRGLAALFVVVNHIFLRAFPGYPVDRAPFWAGWFIYGRFAVVVFIVLSGFSLALSPVRHGWKVDGVSRFAYRRARRILPAYWAALAFSLAVAWFVVAPPGQGAPDVKSVLVNGLLVQNLVGAPSPNDSFWSMAVEAQLYLVFPLLLLMVRRPGAIVMVALAAAAPVLATIWWRGSVWTLDHLFWVDLALGPAIACLLAGLATGHPAALLRLLDARPIRNLGLSSYSLYLTHGPIVVVVSGLIVAGWLGYGVWAFVASLALVLPLTIVFARVFAAVFETPFRPRRSSSGTLRRQHPQAGGAPA